MLVLCDKKLQKESSYKVKKWLYNYEGRWTKKQTINEFILFQLIVAPTFLKQLKVINTYGVEPQKD